MENNLQLKILCFAVLAWVGYKHFGNLPPKRAPVNAMKMVDRNAKDPCFGKARCVVAYFTPWCPACNDSKPLLNTLHAKSQNANFGVRVVVGNDEPARLSEYALEIGPTTFIDTDRSYFRGMNGRSYPSWWLLDNVGNILKLYRGGLGGEDLDAVANVLLLNKLKMDPKFFRPSKLVH